MSLERPDPALDDDTVLFVGHGSRREESNEQVWTLVAKLESRLSVLVDAAYIEPAEPLMDDAIETVTPTCRMMTVVPLSLFVTSHVKNDMPLAVQRARATHDDTEFRLGSHLGIHPSFVNLLDERTRAVESDPGVGREDDGVVVVLCARGSSDLDSNGNAHKLACLLYEGREFTRVGSAFIGVTTSRLEETLHTVAKDRPDAVVVLPYMLGDDMLTERVVDTAEMFDEECPYVDADASGPLGTDARVVETLADRCQKARSGSVEMSCDTCRYKVELAGYEDDEGGARAMLRLLVRQAEHADRSDVDDDPHVHDTPEKYAAICTNQTCATSDATTVLGQLRQGVRDVDDCDIHVSRSSCLGQCGDGPTVAVYPDSVWYDGVTPDDTGRIISSHLERDHIISNLVHQSLQPWPAQSSKRFDWRC